MTLLYGHRGARGKVPENTLPSFQFCLQAGVTRCELDLHLSVDGELIVIHDDTLQRTTGRRGKVSRYTAAELTAMNAHRGGPPCAEPCPIPTLRTLFEQCPFEHWQLEVKTPSRTQAPRLVRAIQQLVEEFSLSEKVVVTSSSRLLLRTAQQIAPQIARGLVAEYTRLDPVKTALRYGCALLVLDRRLCTPERIARAQRQGLHVSAWTVNDPAEIRRLVTAGIDSLITDFPDLAIATLQQPH